MLLRTPTYGPACVLGMAGVLAADAWRVRAALGAAARDGTGQRGRCSMPWRESLEPTRMQRVAVVVPATRLRELLVQVADAGPVELGACPPAGTTAPAGTPPDRRRRCCGSCRAGPTWPHGSRRSRRTCPRAAGTAARTWSPGRPELESRAAVAVRRGTVAALAGWAPSADLPGLAGRIAGSGGAVVPLAVPAGRPPTLLRTGSGLRRSMTPLVQTYATVPYRDLDPTVPAGLAYVFMFGMMFGDAGHGALLVVAALVLSRGRPRRFARYRPGWPFLLGAGLAASRLWGAVR